MENMEEKLKEYFIEHYKPLAILLHGSRAVGKEREHSDWDFIFVMDKPNPEMRRKIIFGQNCEHKIFIYPFADDIVKKDAWHLREGNVRVVYDPQNICTELLAKAAAKAKDKPTWTPADKEAWSAYVLGRIGGMRDYLDEPIAFYGKSDDLIKIAITLWFDIKKGWMNAPQVYDSLPMIKTEDPAYFSLLEIVAGNYPPAEKVGAAEKLHALIFNK
jgi:hypothetical protein